jgi:non-heme chloroperoxidase
MPVILIPDVNSNFKDAKPQPSVRVRRIKGEQKYASIQVPLLAIFASPHSTDRLPPMTDDKKAQYVALDQANSAVQAKVFEKLKSAKVAILPNADHFVFLSNEQGVEKDMKDFLATLKTEGN